MTKKVEIDIPNYTYEEMKQLFFRFPDIEKTVTEKRERTIKLAIENTKEGQTCPSNCRMRNGVGEKGGCRCLETTYDRGACPFYLPRSEVEW